MRAAAISRRGKKWSERMTPRFPGGEFAVSLRAHLTRRRSLLRDAPLPFRLRTMMTARRTISYPAALQQVEAADFIPLDKVAKFLPIAAFLFAAFPALCVTAGRRRSG